jgi:NADP-dependent 3-hydroxy acid dehydrogenase YdfG
VKIAITGHTRGIGKALFDKFQSEGHEVIGFSKSTGYDISKTQSRIMIESRSCDVFINNAFHVTGQLALLVAMLGIWKGTNKLIINVSSKLALYPTIGNLSNNPYISAKVKQGEIVRQAMLNGFPKILNILPGLVDTDMAGVFDSPKKMNPTDLAELVYTITTMKSQLSIQELIVDVPGLNWEDVKFNSTS